MIKYKVIIYWSEEDQVFIPKCRISRDALRTAKRRKRPLNNAQDAIRLWIDTAKEFGYPIPEPKRRRLILA